MTTNDLFSQWAKKSDTPIFSTSQKKAVVYTRVSSKEQFDKNLSLDWQKKAIEDFANRNGFDIMNYYGGTYESAKTDGRKEFQNMLDFIKRHKGKISHILVYLLDRFSRTGGGAIKLAQELREKYGVTIIAVTQPIDTSNPGGVFQQNMQFLFSQYDNELRKQRAVAGIKENLERGIWCKKPPIGYDVIRTNGERKIVVNRQGKLIRKAFEWKAQGMKNEEIIEKLRAMGLKIYKQALSRTFSNPFYCGIISNKMLNGKLVESVHEKVISKELFLAVNNVRQEAQTKFGTYHKKEIDTVPLKVFMYCPKCEAGYTGYIVKKKNLWYYKCRTVGCRSNKNAKKVNEQFVAYLAQFEIKDVFLDDLLEQIIDSFDVLNEANKNQEKEIKASLNALQKKIDTVEEKYFVSGEMGKETYEKLMAKFATEKQEIMASLKTTAVSSSNLESYLQNVASFSSKLATAWSFSPVKEKEKLQKLIFPKGISYCVENEVFRTTKINTVFQLNAVLNSVSEDDINKQGGKKATLSHLVGKTGFEPATPWSQTRKLCLDYLNVMWTF